MRSILLIGMLLMAGAAVPTASADIYFWTDENGVKHYTNTSPPEDAEVFMETPAVGEVTALTEVEAEQAGSLDQALESGQLQAAAEEIKALREQVDELKDRLTARRGPLAIDADDTAAEAEEVSGTIRYQGGYLLWPFPYGYLHHGYKGHHRPRPGHGHGKPGFNNRVVRPKGFNPREDGRRPSLSGHGALAEGPGYRSLRKKTYQTGSVGQRHALGRRPDFTGGDGRR